MNASLALETRDLALEMHHLLRQIDPVRFRASLQEPIRSRLVQVREWIRRMLDSWAWDEAGTLYTSLSNVLSVLEHQLPDAGLPKRAAKRKWRRFQRALADAYAQLSRGLKRFDVVVPNLRATNHARSLTHLASGLTCIALLFVVPLPWQKGLTLLVLALGIGLEVAKRWSPEANARIMQVFGALAHAHEHHKINSMTWYVLACTLMAWWNHKPAAVAALVVLSVSDPAAAFVGRRWGRIKLLHGRTLEGFGAFLATGTVGTALVLGSLYYPTLPWGSILAAAFCGAAAGGVAELVSRRVDDNLSIPLSVFVVVQLLLPSLTP